MAKNRKTKKSNTKLYLIVFFCTLLATLIVFGSITGIYIKGKEARYKRELETAIGHEEKRSKKTGEEPTIKKELDLNTLDGLIEASERVNILLLGTDGGRSDTIILASYEPENRILDFVTVPRDTYHRVPGHNMLAQKKINAVYGFGKKEGGGKGMKAEVSQILKVPIHYYVIADYQSIAAIVNSIGGVEVYVDQKMDYDDEYCDPPLHIHFEVGSHNLDGSQAIQYLRWRKNNGEDGAGDIPRTRRQIDFVKKIISKTVSSFKYDDVIKTCYDYVSTDMPITEVIFYASTLFGFDPENDIETHILPGEAVFNQLSYYEHDEEATKEMMMEIYKKGLVEEENKENEAKNQEDNEE